MNKCAIQMKVEELELEENDAHKMLLMEARVDNGEESIKLLYSASKMIT